MLPSGKISARAAILNVPLFGLHAADGTLSGAGLYFSTLQIILFALSLWHTALVSEVVGWWMAGSPRAPLAAPESSTSRSTSPWFRALCQLAFVGLTASTLIGISVNTSAWRLAAAFDLSDKVDPDQVNLPANMYQDLWAPARILLPAKASSADTVREGLCTLLSDGSRADLHITGAHDPTPLWAKDDDSSSLDALMKMMVCYLSELSCMRDAMFAAPGASAPLRWLQPLRASAHCLSNRHWGARRCCCA